MSKLSVNRTDLAAFKAWLNAYGRAREDRDPEAAAALYAEDGTYQVTPFLEPIHGRRAIFEYWSEVAATQENIVFEYEILVASPERNIARWTASFVRVPPSLNTKLDGIFLISLDEEGRCKSLQEWWHKQQSCLRTCQPPTPERRCPPKSCSHHQSCNRKCANIHPRSSELMVKSAARALDTEL
jgi:hypothetical protein